MFVLLEKKEYKPEISIYSELENSEYMEISGLYFRVLKKNVLLKPKGDLSLWVFRSLGNCSLEPGQTHGHQGRPHRGTNLGEKWQATLREEVINLKPCRVNSDFCFSCGF